MSKATSKAKATSKTKTSSRFDGLEVVDTKPKGEPTVPAPSRDMSKLEVMVDNDPYSSEAPTTAAEPTAEAPTTEESAQVTKQRKAGRGKPKGDASDVVGDKDRQKALKGGFKRANTGFSVGDAKAHVDEKGVQRNALGLESTASHKHVSVVWQKTCHQLSKELEASKAQDETKSDVMVGRGSFKVDTDDEGRIVVSDKTLAEVELEGQYRLTDHAVMGLADFTDIPMEAIKWLMKTGRRWDVCKFVNEELDKAKDTKKAGQFLLRLRDHSEDDEVKLVRHIASDQYTKFDNTAAIEAIDWAFGDRGIKDVLVSHRSNGDEGSDIMFMNLLIPDSMKTYPDSDYGVGIAVRNSEIGTSSFGFAPFLYRAICLNGSIWSRLDAVIKATQKHAGGFNIAELREQIKAALEVALSEGMILMEATQNAKEISLSSQTAATKVIAHLGKKNKLSIPQTQKWAEAWKGSYGAEPTAFSIVQGLTEAAQAWDGRTRYDMESLGGNLLVPGRDASLREIMAYWATTESYAEHETEKVVLQYTGVAL